MKHHVQLPQWVLDVLGPTVRWWQHLNIVESTVLGITLLAAFVLAGEWLKLLKRLWQDRFSSKEEVRRRFMVNHHRPRPDWPGDILPRERLKKRK